MYGRYDELVLAAVCRMYEVNFVESTLQKEKQIGVSMTISTFLSQLLFPLTVQLSDVTGAACCATAIIQLVQAQGRGRRCF
jgi:hypothetical protein